MVQTKTEHAASMVSHAYEAPLFRYKYDVGEFPSTEEGLAALVSPPKGTENLWKGPYVEKNLEDPWGNSYQYKFPGTHGKFPYDLYTYGPDGIESEDDIGSWMEVTPNTNEFLDGKFFVGISILALCIFALVFWRWKICHKVEPVAGGDAVR